MEQMVLGLYSPFAKGYSSRFSPGWAELSYLDIKNTSSVFCPICVQLYLFCALFLNLEKVLVQVTLLWFDEVLSRVYCVKEECEYPGTELCGYRQPYGFHGCLRPDQVNWDGAVNLRRFRRLRRSECVWECQKHNALNQIVVTRYIYNQLIIQSINQSELIE